MTAHVEEPASVEEMVQRVIAEYGGIDVLCNNAGKGGVEKLTELTMRHYDEVMDTNVRGMLLCMKYTIPAMIERGGGSIINIASIASFIGLPASASYCASKGAVLNLTRQSALELAADGVRVYAVAPGYIQTEMFDSYVDVQPDSETRRREILKAIPMRRLGTPEDVANAALFFASDESRWVTGAHLVVDGGTLCH